MDILPIQETVTAKGHTAQYKMHKYFARRPYNVFSNLINHYTKEGDIILDCFCGGGVTIFEALKLDRKVIGVDINPLATFITEMQIQQVDVKVLEDFLFEFLKKVKNELDDLYKVEIDNEVGVMEWMEWAYEVKCPYCNENILLTEENKISNGKYKCSNNKCSSHNENKGKGIVRTKCEPNGCSPLKVKYKIIKTNEIKTRIINKECEEIKRIMESLTIPNKYITIDDKIPHNWDRWHEDCLGQKGIYKFSDLFTKRNLLANTIIFNNILNIKTTNTRLKDLLYFAFSSSLRYTNNMTRVTQNWENGNPTSMDKHAYWLPNQFVENNVVNKLEERMKAIIKGIKYSNESLRNTKIKANSYDELLKERDYMILNKSSAELELPDKSVDVIITDPPYGSNVQYAELSSFWNVWYKIYKNLDSFIYNKEEAISNRKNNFEGCKNVEFYGEMLYKVFREGNRVLKDDGYLVFTFNNKDINVWVQLLKATVKAGFYLPKNGVIYQDFIKEYKNTSHLKYSGNVHGDFIYSFKKGTVKIDISIKEKDYKVYLVERIESCLKEMYGIKGIYTTTELYENIFSELIGILVQFILIEENSEDEQLEKIEELSNTFIDDVLSKYLILTDKGWTIKNE